MFFNVYILPHAWQLISAVHLLFIIFVLFFERQGSARRMAWLLALVFLPVVGMLLYIMFSGHFFTRTKRMIKTKRFVYMQMAPFYQIQHDFFISHADDIADPRIRENLPFITMNLTRGASLLSFSDSVEFFCWGEDMFERLCGELAAAKSSIHLEYFTFRNDATGRRILSILCEKARDGVEVKLLYDDFGSILTPAAFFRQLDKAGGESRAFFRVRTGLPLSINFRNHRKVAVIDGEIGYMGGVNVGDEYANCSRHRKPLWRDTHIRLTGSSVPALQMYFLLDWYSVTAWDSRTHKVPDLYRYFPQSFLTALSDELERKTYADFISDSANMNRVPTQIMTAGPNDTNVGAIEDALIYMIMRAKKSVYIQTPYFTPDEPFFTALKIAAGAGIDVRVMVPGKWDKFYVRAAAMEFMRELLAFGVKFYAYPGFIHAKTLVIDSELVTVGSTNIDQRSFQLHFEINAFFYDAPTARRYADIFAEDQKVCTPVDADALNAKFIGVRAWWGFCKLFSPLM